LAASAPEQMKNFNSVNESVFTEEALSVKHKELIAFALTNQCSYCLEIHKKKARKAGASDAEIAEIALNWSPSAPSNGSVTSRRDKVRNISGS